MTLTTHEQDQLTILLAKKTHTNGRWLDDVERRVRNVYNYDDSFKALMIWQKHADILQEVIRDNRDLIGEVKRLQKYEKLVADQEITSKGEEV